MTNLTELLNIELGTELTQRTNGVIFCSNNLKESFTCKPEYMIEALNNAEYYMEDGDFDDDLVDALCDIATDNGSACIFDEVVEKQIWFDVKS